MNTSYVFKRLHILGIVWFLLCIAFLFVFSLYQMGYHWWATFSISTYSAVIVLFLMTVYLFAIYKGVVRNSNSIEHPLTTSPYYVLLYDLTPFLGSIVGLYVASPGQSALLLFSTVAQGTLFMTFMMWILVDSIADLLESSCPQSVKHRKNRLAVMQEQKRLQALEREKTLERIDLHEKQSHLEWTLLFKPYTIEIAGLLCGSLGNAQAVQRRIVELGALAWRQGGLLAMQFFYAAILQEVREHMTGSSVDFVALHWDGIGNWRKPEDISRLYIEPQS